MPEDPTGNVVRNLFALRHLENELAVEADRLLRDLFDDIAAEMGRLDLSESMDASTREIRLRRLMEEVQALTGQTFDEVRELIEDGGTTIGFAQARWAEQQLFDTVGRDALAQVGVDVSAGRVSRERIRAILTEDPFEGAILRDWADRQAESTVFQVRRQVQLGMAQGETLGDMVRRVRGRQAGFLRQDPDTGRFVPQGTEGANVRPRFRGGVLSTQTRHTEALVRTAINHVANRAHAATYAANQDITETWTYTATLDSRTTEICMGLDGQVFPHGEGPVPPNHFNALPGGSRITTRDGLAPVECVRVGDRVLTHEGRWRRVYAAMGKRHDGTVRELCLSTGGRLRVTDEHPVLTLNAGWKRADEVEVGDQVVQHREQATEVPAGVDVSEVSQAAVRTAHDRPSSFDEPAVPYSVLVTAAGVSPSVQLQSQLRTREGEVDDVGSDGVLEAEVDAGPVKGVNQPRLMAGRVPSVRLRSRSGGLAAIGRVGHRVVSGHPPRVLFREPRRRLGLLGSPMVVAGRVIPLGGMERGGFGLPSDRDAVAVAGCVEGGLAQLQVPLDGPDAFLSLPVTTTDEGLNGGGVRQVNGRHGSSPWVVATIISTADREHHGHVWNLAVEGDETFVADGVVVHNCRSVQTPNVKWEELGIDPPEEGTRASADGQVPASTRYEDWLRDQGSEVQDEILGPGRAKLFRQGKIDLRQLVTRDFRRRTLDELREAAA